MEGMKCGVYTCRCVKIAWMIGCVCLSLCSGVWLEFWKGSSLGKKMAFCEIHVHDIVCTMYTACGITFKLLCVMCIFTCAHTQTVSWRCHEQRTEISLPYHEGSQHSAPAADHCTQRLPHRDSRWGGQVAWETTDHGQPHTAALFQEGLPRQTILHRLWYMCDMYIYTSMGSSSLIPRPDAHICVQLGLGMRLGWEHFISPMRGRIKGLVTGYISYSSDSTGWYLYYPNHFLVSPRKRN